MHLVDGVQTVYFVQIEKRKALVQITLNGAEIDTKLFNQCVWVEFFTFIEATQISVSRKAMVS